MLHYVESTPTLDTNIYADLDRLGDVKAIETGAPGGSIVYLRQIRIVDLADQGAALDVLFFKSSVTPDSADNAALDIPDSEATKFQARVQVASTTYADFTDNKCATVTDLAVPLKTDTDGKVYVLLQSRGTPTYAASSLTLGYTFESYEV